MQLPKLLLLVQVLLLGASYDNLMHAAMHEMPCRTNCLCDYGRKRGGAQGILIVTHTPLPQPHRYLV
jgi:hypothetical protein